MPTNPPPPHSTRLENLSLDPQGAAFGLEGRPIRLNGDGYAAPVASMQELYHHALADYYQRAAELSRQSAAQRPPLLSRLLSWVGRVFDRLRPAPSGGLAVPPIPPPAMPGAAAPSAGHSAAAAAHPPRETALVIPPLLTTVAPRTLTSPAAPEKSQAGKPDALRPNGTAPVLHVIFADQDGVHVIWQLAATKRDPGSKSRDRAEPKASQPRLELTYSLDSSMAQRLQDCYGQLAQLGYKITGLEAVRAAPEKSAQGKEATKPVPAAPAPKPAAETSVITAPPATEPPPPPRRARPKPDAPPVPTAPASAAPEPLDRNPSFLPGL
jgi:hypothetical protein